MNLEQYKLISARRIAQNNLVWQTPTLASAAQAFLLSAAVQQKPGVMPILLALFAAAVGMAAIQLMIKHRYVEILDARLLRRFEEAQAPECQYAVLHARPPRCFVPKNANLVDRLWVRFANLRANLVWTFILTGFLGLDAFVACHALWALISN